MELSSQTLLDDQNVTGPSTSRQQVGPSKLQIAGGLRRSRCGVSAIAGGLRRSRCGAPSAESSFQEKLPTAWEKLLFCMAWAHVSTRRCTVAAFSDERSSGKDTRKSADAQKVKIASKMSPQPIVFVFFSPEFFCLIFPSRTVQKRHFSAIISGTWADFPQRLRQTLPIRGVGSLATISAMKNGATALRNRKSIFTKKNV